ncbi:MAG: hypothetical protein J6P40_12305 [Oscillospiraceae bacterium]|nr:hypothetical protein [Oscillospiraceae bacterium]
MKKVLTAILSIVLLLQSAPAVFAGDDTPQQEIAELPLENIELSSTDKE